MGASSNCTEGCLFPGKLTVRTGTATVGSFGGGRDTGGFRGRRRVGTTGTSTTGLRNGVIGIATGTNTGNGLFNSMANGSVSTTVGRRLKVRISGHGVTITSVGRFNAFRTRIGICRKVNTGVSIRISRTWFMVDRWDKHCYRGVVRGQVVGRYQVRAVWVWRRYLVVSEPDERYSILF